MTRKRKPQSTPADPSMSPAEKIVASVMSAGFRPGARMHADVVEFTKDYAPADSRARLRVHLFFDKPHGGGTPRLANLVFSSQLAVAPRTDEFPAGLTDETRTELATLLDDLEMFVGMPQRTLAARTCRRCEETSDDYFVVNATVICYRCVHGHARE